jgi:hypothetical protein
MAKCVEKRHQNLEKVIATIPNGSNARNIDTFPDLTLNYNLQEISPILQEF